MTVKRIEERYNISINIDGADVDWEHFILEEFQLHESVKQKFPTAELNFACDYKYILERPVLDGSSVIITLEDTQMQPPSAPQTFRLRAFNTKFKAVAQQFKCYVSLYLDAQDLHTAKSKSYGKTTSSNAIAAAASDAGLTPSVDPSADVQKWLRPNIKGSDFIYRTAQRSFAGPMSCFVTGIGATHTLRHYDIHSRMGKSPTWMFRNIPQEGYLPQANEILYEEAVFKTVSGTNNSYAGYGRTTGVFDLMKGFDSLKADLAGLSSGSFNVAQKLMGAQRSETAAYMSDNVHKNYAQAAVQNTSIKSLFSCIIELTTRFGRNVLLLDYVNIEPHCMGLNNITDNGVLTPWAGGYFVSEIHTMVTSYAVGKKYHLLREGLNFGDLRFGL